MGRSTSRALRLLESLYRQPVVTLSQISQVCDITFQGASDLAKHLAALSILKETTGQKRHRLFAYARYLSLLGEPVRRKTKLKHRRDLMAVRSQHSQHTVFGGGNQSVPRTTASVV